jgi:hypothetical protein
MKPDANAGSMIGSRAVRSKALGNYLPVFFDLGQRSI